MVDTARLGAQMVQQHFTCTVLDIPSGTPPLLITVRLPTIDSPANVARWFGFPDISVGSSVICRRDPNDQDVLVVEGSGDEAISSSGSQTVINSSGAAAAVGDVGYIDEAGEYQTTTTAEAIVAWCVVTVGGADSAEIQVKRRGSKITVNYTGSAPAKGNFLTTSATAGSAQGRSTMHPAVFAVCTGAGSGGVVEALLLINRTPISVTSDPEVCRVSSHSGTNFTATIAAISGSNVEYTITGGTNEDSIVTSNSNQLAKIVLHNTTRSDSALISTVNTTNTGTPADGTITLTATAPGTWQVGDVITTRSQTNTDVVGAEYFIDMDFGNGSNSVVGLLVTKFFGELTYQDTSTDGLVCLLHPYTAGTGGGRTGLASDVGIAMRRYVDIPLIDRKFTILARAGGSATATHVLRVSQLEIASP